MQPIYVLLPSLITMIGAACSAAWLAGAPWYLAIVALLLDDLDGWTARRLRVCTKFGAELDWHLDVIVCAAIAARFTPWLLCVLAPWLALAKSKSWRISLRAAMTIACLVVGATR